MSWRSVRVRAPLGDQAAVTALLFELGALGVQIDDAETRAPAAPHGSGDPPIELATHFPEPFDTAEFSRRLAAVSPTATAETAPTPEVDWRERWRDRLAAHDLGALTIAPPWLADPAAAARTIVIDPAMAFGTGDHPTTRGAVRLMSAVVRPGDTVADLGAGSAVLSIAAARLGARRVAAIELDPDAIENAEENVARNGAAGQVTVIEGDASVILPLVAPVEVILANIVSSVIVPLLPAMRSALARGAGAAGDRDAGAAGDTAGAAVIAGILLSERDDLLAALDREGWTVAAEDVEGEWWSATIRPRP